MNREDDNQLWDLLGRAPQPKVSPFFARNILRQLRQDPAWKIAARAWFGWRRLVPATGVAVAIIGATLWLLHPGAEEKDAPVEYDPVAQIDPQDYDVVADLDVLLTVEENNLWDDTSSL